MADSDERVDDQHADDGRMETGPVDAGQVDEEPTEPVRRHEHHGVQRIADRMRGMGVGFEDPNIIGNAGPYDVPPGADPPTPLPQDPSASFTSDPSDPSDPPDPPEPSPH
jgi:hypothetical protein